MTENAMLHACFVFKSYHIIVISDWACLGSAPVFFFAVFEVLNGSVQIRSARFGQAVMPILNVVDAAFVQMIMEFPWRDRA